MSDLVLIQQINKIRGPANRATVLIDPAAVVGVRLDPVGLHTVRVVLLLPGHEVTLPASPYGTDEFEDSHEAMRAVQLLMPERFGSHTTDWLEINR